MPIPLIRSNHAKVHSTCKAEPKQLLFSATTGREQVQQTARLFDDLISAGEYGRGEVDAERLRGLEIDYQLIPSRRLHRQIGGLLAPENTIDVRGRASVLVDEVSSI